MIAIGLLLFFGGVAALRSQGAQGVFLNFTRQTANTQFTLPIPAGCVTHTVTIQATGSLTGLATLVEADTGGGNFVVLGQSTLLADSVSWTGAYATLRITYSNVTGSGQIDGTYFGTPR
jgi:hypothetical protein